MPKSGRVKRARVSRIYDDRSPTGRWLTRSSGRHSSTGCGYHTVAPINDLVDELYDLAGRGWLPYLAPLYGGINAKMLNIFRDPGPATHRDLPHGGFLCLENNDPAAERLALFLDEAGIASDELLTWNAYPWFINRKPTAAELDAGVLPLHRLLGLLPRLRVVMLNGRESKVTWRKYAKRYPTSARRVHVIGTYHTGNQAFIGNAEVRAARMSHLREAFAEAAAVLRR